MERWLVLLTAGSDLGFLCGLGVGLGVGGSVRCWVLRELGSLVCGPAFALSASMAFGLSGLLGGVGVRAGCGGIPLSLFGWWAGLMGMAGFRS